MGECYIHLVTSIELIARRKIWDTQRNIGVVEKWALKKEEPEKEIRKNKTTK